MDYIFYIIAIFVVFFDSCKGQPKKVFPPNIKTKTISNSLEPCKIYSLPPNYKEDCDKEGGIYTSTYSMGLCSNNKSCKCSYFTCLKENHKSTKTTPKLKLTKPSTLEPCKIYSLPPYFRENCTKDGGIVTETFSKGSCNNKECKCPYMTCITESPKSSVKTTPRITTSTVNTKSTATTLPPCMTYSLPPYFRENCTKSGGIVTQTHSMAICNKSEPCECPYYSCIAGNPKTDTINLKEPTTLPPCLTYSLPPYFKDNCTKSGGRVTETYSKAYCHNNEVCQCPYYTCINNEEQTSVDEETNIKKETITVTKTHEPKATSDTNTKCVRKWGQCGGIGFKGSSCCESGLTCREINKYYSQCM